LKIHFGKYFINKTKTKMIRKITAVLFFLAFGTSLLNAQITFYPYYQSGSGPGGWTVIQTTPIWSFGFASVGPSGKLNDTAIICNNFAYVAGTAGTLVSPVFNFTSLAKPVVHFYVAHRSYTSAENDSLIVKISTNGGVTFIDTPVPYKKARSSNPSLATLVPSTVNYNPSSASHWRQESIDLSAYGGFPSVIIAIRGVGGFGNNLWLDDFTVNDAASICVSNVTAPGNYGCNPLVNITMNSTGNPTGGKLSVLQHIYTGYVSTYSPINIAANTTATTHDGSIFTPNVVSPDGWFTVAYSGNDFSGTANYDISIDLSSYLFLNDITKVYIVKRTTIGSPWVALNTTTNGTSVKASGVTSFSDFAIAGDSLNNPLPVELTSFVAAINGRNVELKWTTSSELNNAGFDIERKTDASETWNKLGYINGNGTTSQSSNYSFTDRNLASGKYNYRLKQTDFNGNFTYYNLSSEVIAGIPEKFALSQNYPNPFNPSTVINYDLPFDGKVSLKVFDMSGKEVASLVNELKTAGYHSVSFNASGIPSGVYFYKLSGESEGNNFSAVKKMLLVK
jgi:hypothetical protein